jgi:hypothetical protein
VASENQQQNERRGEAGALSSYGHLVNLWTSGIRDYHSLLSDYLTANSVFVAAIGFLVSRQPIERIFAVVVVVLCCFGILLTVQMAIVLGRFAAQNKVWEWQLLNIEESPSWQQEKLFVDLQRFRDQHLPLQNERNSPPALFPNWATKQHRQWWAHREISFPFFFGSVYVLFLIWSITTIF